jgi:Ca2+-binding RTX toxin-like protein
MAFFRAGLDPDSNVALDMLGFDFASLFGYDSFVVLPGGIRYYNAASGNNGGDYFVLEGTVTVDPVTGIPNGGEITAMRAALNFAQQFEFEFDDPLHPVGAVQFYNLAQAATDQAGRLAAFDYLYGPNLGVDLYGAALDDILLGSNQSDFIYGGGGGDFIFGRDGSDQIEGGGGDDQIYGGSGIDYLYGNSGNDLFVADNLEDIVDGGDDYDSIIIDYTERSNSTYFQNFDDAFYDMSLTSVEGLAGYLGSENSDTVVIYSFDPMLFLGVSQGANFDLGGGADEFILLDRGFDEDGNLVEGVIVDTVINGGAGDDSIIAGRGNDRIDGGSGADELFGGDGNDTITVDQFDSAFGGNSDGFDDGFIDALVIDLSGASDDFSINLSSAFQGGSFFIGTTGVVAGFEGLQSYSGSQGVDVLYLSQTATPFDDGQIFVELNAGDDILYCGVAGVSVDAGTGDDFVSGSSQADRINGGAGRDVLNGNAGLDDLFGGAGDDRLDGGAGADRLTGGAGNDRYTIDAIGDLVIETVGEGVDSVFSSISWVMTANVEKLFLTGTSNIDGFGNKLGNSISGNAGNNVLAGGRGTDTLKGGLGADTFVYARGDGRDTITDFRSAHGDVIEFGWGGLIDSFDELLAAATQVGADVRIAINANNTLTLKNVQLASLSDDDFLFA